MESFAKGDRVSLKEKLGPLGPGSMGLVVEVYSETALEFTAADGCSDIDVIGTKDFDLYAGATLFDYGVVFPALRGFMSDYTEGKWFTDKVDLSQFHAGDVIPLAHDELNFIDSELRGVMG